MSKIIKLDKNLANQIAAGEVVERPVSIVKELVENGIDAWSDYIKIEIKEWWINHISINDNWEWIQKEDLYLTLEKYSTSKIKNQEDLYNVMTFWFRWEALASISSISNITIISQYKKSDFWYSFSVKDWKTSEIKKYPSEIWTKIIVEDLFYNTPARLNYLKKPRTEYSHIHSFLQQISLSYPKIWFEFISDKKTIFKLVKNEDLKTRIYKVYGEEFSKNMLEINFDLNWIKIYGYISDPKISFPNRNRQSIFVNKRVIKSPLISKAVNDAYNRFISSKTFPSYVLNISVDPTQVDVNVHPRKTEIRFANEQNIFRSLYHIIQERLDKISLVSQENMYFSENTCEPKPIYENICEPKPKYNANSWTNSKSYQQYDNKVWDSPQLTIQDSIKFSKQILNSDFETDFNSHNQKNNTDKFFTENSNDLKDTPIWKIIWQLNNSYILVETEEWIKFFDQHALAERVIYKKLTDSKYEAKTQLLLIWENFNLTPKEINILEENDGVFKKIWFDFEIISWNSVLLNGIPDFMKKENIKLIFLWILEDVSKNNIWKSKTLEEVRNKIFAYTACRSAIKFWDKLNIFEINKLLKDASNEYSDTCPHWRPVVFEISLDEIRKNFWR